MKLVLEPIHSYFMNRWICSKTSDFKLFSKSSRKIHKTWNL